MSDPNQNSSSSQPIRYYTKQDIMQMLMDEGYDQTNCFVEPQGMNLLIQLAHNFVQQVLDTYKYKKKQINANDIKKAIALKFPDIYTGDNIDNKVILQNRSNALDENDQRVREIQKKSNE